MNDEQALLAAIAANKDDDTLRLAYADHLDELGGEANQAHAEYIRIQVQHYRFPEFEWDSARESFLFRTFFRKWYPQIPGFEIPVNTRRGFRYLGKAHASAVLAAADDPQSSLFDEFTLFVDVLKDQLWQVIRLPLIRCLKSLVLFDADADIVAEVQFPRLESLSISGVSDAGFRAMCSATGFPKLQVLDLHTDQFFEDSLTLPGIDKFSNTRGLVGLPVFRLHLRRDLQPSGRVQSRLRSHFGPGFVIC